MNKKDLADMTSGKKKTHVDTMTEPVEVPGSIREADTRNKIDKKKEAGA